MKYYLLLLLVFLTGCKQPTDQSVELNATDNTVDVASQAVAASKSRMSKIDGGIASLQAHQAENPAKMQRLISSCQVETGAVMEGEGAMQITTCVNSRW